MSEVVNPIPPDVTLHDLVVLIDMHSTVLVNPMQLYPQLVESVGRFKAGLLWASAMAIVLVRDDCAAGDVTPAEMIPAALVVPCGVLAFLLDGSARPALVAAAAVLAAVAVCHRLARAYREGDL